MTFSELLATLTAMLAPEPDTSAFTRLIAGGYDGRAPVEIQTCPRPLDPSEVEGETVICGIVTVPEDHDAPENGRTIDLEFVLLKAESSYAVSDPLLYLHGGPGGGNLPGGVHFVSQNFGPFRDTRDLIAFDQRAAGISSDSIECTNVLTGNIDGVLADGAGLLEEVEGGYAPSQLLRDCLAEIEASGVDLSKYNTRQNALDSQMVMRALGYDSWNIYGASYGTKLTLEVMRTAPEGVRAAVLDGVATPAVRLYDTIVQPSSEAVGRLVRYCAEDEACNTAYPDLGTVILDLYEKAGTEGIPYRDEVFDADAIAAIVGRLNDPNPGGSYARYLPAIFFELHRGKETPTFDLVYGEWDFYPPDTTEQDLRAMARETLDDAGMAIFEDALTSGRIAEQARGQSGNAVKRLREHLRRDRQMGPLAALLDAELSAALTDAVVNSEEARALLRDYAELRDGDPGADRLATFVTSHFAGSHEARLLALIEAMTGAEVAGFFEDVYTAFEPASFAAFQKELDLAVFYCQEDIPYNSPEGYEELTESLAYPLRAGWDDLAKKMFAMCEAFDQHPREGFHEVVVSDIPTITIGSAWDQNTAGSWAALATEGLSNSQTFMIQEAGHVAFRFQPCVAELAHAFFDKPDRELGDACEREAAVPPFHIADWARP